MKLSLLKLSGIFSVIGIVPLLVAEFIGVFGGDPLSTTAALAEMISFLFLPIGIAGLYYVQQDKMKTLGLIFTLFIIWGQIWGNAGLGGSLIYRDLIPNWAGESTMIGVMKAGGLPSILLSVSILFFGTLGMVGFGFLCIRAKNFKPLFSWSYFIGALGLAVFIPINPQIGHGFNILLGVAWAGMGWQLYSNHK